jgi:hypothetical protein
MNRIVCDVRGKKRNLSRPQAALRAIMSPASTWRKKYSFEKPSYG